MCSEIHTFRLHAERLFWGVTFDLGTGLVDTFHPPEVHSQTGVNEMLWRDVIKLPYLIPQTDVTVTEASR